MLNSESLVSQKAASSLKVFFLCRGLLNRGQLSLERFEFWQPTSQLLALDVCLSDAFA
ncbi:DUF645 family protein [Vibrio cholerae]|nr:MULTISPECIES: DUF645 family protein [Vibrio]AUW38451.1 DUF645 domain-containing protein [Vibrio mimicus]EHU8078579.1 DUF645 family protein [Vibrio cholerae]EHV9954609.1 DUF645 family protein [Vibrio cholerae]EKF9596323.1 DUF645 family protein [Vibrio cholerae]EKF9828337.1 DUF645 family protein [Vibrio cholerae]